MTIPECCDYLVVGGGATGMAFVDTFLNHYNDDNNDKTSSPPSILMVDKHSKPGGQWNDSYEFVQLHQPSSMYGVETLTLEKPTTSEGGDELHHRATRTEILNYYEQVQTKLSAKYNFQYLGNTTVDLDSMIIEEKDDTDSSTTTTKVTLKTTTTIIDSNNTTTTSTTTTIVQVNKRIVDARYLEPDLPIFVKPKFSYDENQINCVPVNSLYTSTTTTTSTNDESSRTTSTSTTSNKNYVVIGGGKTGMDAISYLLTKRNISPTNIMWIVPNDVWITARENIGTCIEFLYECCTIAAAAKTVAKVDDDDDGKSLKDMLQSSELLQLAFQEWEKSGKIYRLDTTASLPTKFKDATLSREELKLIQTVSNNNIIKEGRITQIGNEGQLHFVNGNVLNLPTTWKVDETTFVHCSAGAFHYTKQQQDNVHQTPKPFTTHKITIQDVYGTPGFCFVGSIFGYLESLSDTTTTNQLSDDEHKNELLLAPQKNVLPDKKDDDDDDENKSSSSSSNPSLGPSGGDIEGFNKNHGLIQRYENLKRWMAIPSLRSWLIGHRLFNLGNKSATEIDRMIEDITKVLKEGEIII